MSLSHGRILRASALGICALASTFSAAHAGDFLINWGTAPYVWAANSTGPNTYTMTDQYGFQLDARMSVTRFGGSALNGYPNDLTGFGTNTSIWLVWDANNGSGRVGESTNTATLEFLNGGSPFAVNALSFQVTDIDPNDANASNDRCDFITATGNAGNPALSYVSPNAASRTFRIGVQNGSGATGQLAANQAQCIYDTSNIQAPGSNGDDFGSLLLTYPNGTSVATVQYDESIENVYNANRDASARGVGVWGATAVSVNNTISLTKTTAATQYSASGQTLTYTYTVTNNGPLPFNTGQNIQIQDDKIGTFNCGTISSAVPAGGTVSCNRNYTVTAADMSAPNVTNNAIAGVGTGTQAFAARLQSNTATVTVPRLVLPTMRMTKISNGGTGAFPFSGTNGYTGHTITTTAAGGAGTAGPVRTLTAASTATTITETIPAGWSLTGVTCTGLGPGGTFTPNLSTGAVAFNAAATASGSNIACTFINDRRVDLAITKTVDNATPSEGDAVTFTLSAVNNGPARATNVSMSDVLPAGLTYSSHVASGTAYAPGSGIWSIGTLANGASATLTITATVNAGTAGSTLTNTITGVTLDQVDTNTTPDDLSESVTVNDPSLTIVKTGNFTTGTAPASVGDVIEYTYTVENTGNVPVTDIQVTDSHNGNGAFALNPDHTTLTDNGTTGDSPDSNADATIWGTLAPGDVITFTADYTVTQTDVDTLQ